MKLTPQQIEYFNREGWLSLPELFSPEEGAYLAREAEGLAEPARSRAKETGLGEFPPSPHLV